MAKFAAKPESSISFSDNSRLAEDTVFFAIFPDTSLSSSSSAAELSSYLQSLQLEILQSVSRYSTSYIWQHESFSLSLSSTSSLCTCSNYHNLFPPPHLHGKVRFGDNLEDEWFTVFLLFEISRNFGNVSVRVWDNDGEFLLIQAAFHLPRWINPENSQNRVFIRRGDLHIIPRKLLPNPNLVDSMKLLINSSEDSRAADQVQQAVKNQIAGYPERALKNMHQVRVRVPPTVAQVLKHDPSLVSLAVEGFYDRDMDTMKFAAKMERFLRNGAGQELVCTSVRMSRAMYAQLVQQNFQAPKCYPMPSRSDDKEAYAEAEMGMKISCGFEMIYQQMKMEGDGGKGSTWQKYVENLETTGYFEGLLAGSEEYRKLMDNAEEHYRKSSASSRTSEKLSEPVRRIDEILQLPYAATDFGVDVPPSDDDSWLYDGEDELNSVLLERQNEMELYNSKHKKKQPLKEPTNSGLGSSSNYDDFGLQEITKTMQKFIDTVSSYEGAEVPKDRNMNQVDIDPDRFLKDMELALRGRHEHEDMDKEVDIGEDSSSEIDCDESEDWSDADDSSDENEDGENAFMQTYSDALDNQLRNTTLQKSFVGKDNQENEGTSSSAMEEEFSPVDVDVNLLMSLMDSFSSQQGQPGPASNMLGLMGLKLPLPSDVTKK